jgi:predicted DNA-binding transcriptional regulator AlpA
MKRSTTAGSPKRVHPGGRGSFWIEDEIKEWLHERIAAERNLQGGSADAD